MLTRVESRGVGYELVACFFDGVVQAISAAGVAFCSVGVSLMARDLLKTSRLRWRRDSANSSCCSASTAPTRWIRELRSGKMPTTSARRHGRRW